MSVQGTSESGGTLNGNPIIYEEVWVEEDPIDRNNEQRFEAVFSFYRLLEGTTSIPAELMEDARQSAQRGNASKVVAILEYLKDDSGISRADGYDLIAHSYEQWALINEDEAGMHWSEFFNAAKRERLNEQVVSREFRSYQWSSKKAVLLFAVAQRCRRKAQELRGDS